MCCSVVFGVTLRLLVINISSLCSAINNLRRLPPAIRVTTCGTMVQRRRIDNTWPAAALRARSEARYRLRSAISAYPTCIRRPPSKGGGSRRNIPMPFGTKKTRMAWLPDGEKCWRYVYSFWQNSRTWQTDTATSKAALIARQWTRVAILLTVNSVYYAFKHKINLKIKTQFVQTQQLSMRYEFDTIQCLGMACLAVLINWLTYWSISTCYHCFAKLQTCLVVSLLSGWPCIR